MSVGSFAFINVLIGAETVPGTGTPGHLYLKQDGTLYAAMAGGVVKPVNICSSTAFGDSLMEVADASACRTLIGAKGLAATGVGVGLIATTSLLTGVDTPVAWDDERWDTSNFHDNVTLNTRLVAPVAGHYTIGFHLEFSASGLGTYRQAGFRINGTATQVTSRAGDIGAANPTMVYGGCSPVLAVGDYVEVMMKHDASATLTATANCHATLTFIGT